MNPALTLEEIIPPYIEVTRGNHIKAYLKNATADFLTIYPEKIASSISEGEMLDKIISYLERDVENLKRHRENFNK